MPESFLKIKSQQLGGVGQFEKGLPKKCRAIPANAGIAPGFLAEVEFKGVIAGENFLLLLGGRDYMSVKARVEGIPRIKITDATDDPLYEPPLTPNCERASTYLLIDRLQQNQQHSI